MIASHSCVCVHRLQSNSQNHVQEVDSFLLRQSVDALPGVGWSAQEKLEALGVRTVADLRSFDKARLQAELGPRTAEDMWQYAWGKDDRQVRIERGFLPVACTSSSRARYACTPLECGRVQVYSFARAPTTHGVAGGGAGPTQERGSRGELRHPLREPCGGAPPAGGVVAGGGAPHEPRSGKGPHGDAEAKAVRTWASTSDLLSFCKRHA